MHENRIRVEIHPSHRSRRTAALDFFHCGLLLFHESRSLAAIGSQDPFWALLWKGRLTKQKIL